MVGQVVPGRGWREGPGSASPLWGENGAGKARRGCGVSRARHVERPAEKVLRLGALVRLGARGTADWTPTSGVWRSASATVLGCTPWRSARQTLDMSPAEPCFRLGAARGGKPRGRAAEVGHGLCRRESYGPRNLRPSKWIKWSGSSAIQTSVSHAISPAYRLKSSRLRKAVT